MAKIAYGMAGEGRGHATRVRAMVERLRGEHDLTLYASGQAFDLLAPQYTGTNVVVRRLPGLQFHYTRRGTLNHLLTAWHGLRFLADAPRQLALLRRELSHQRPDLVITDFEPLLPRAAQSLGIPFVSLAHQQFLIVNDLRELPLHLQAFAALMGWVVRAFYRGQAATIVSSFFAAPIKPAYRNAVTQVGVLLRPEVVRAASSNQGYLVAYLRRFAPPSVLRALRQCGRRVHIYGLGARGEDGNLVFHEVSVGGFVRHLAGCEALISTAGNQLIGEALYLGKPVLALPEPFNFEQYINAHFLARSGAGAWLPLKQLTADAIAAFLARRDEFVAVARCRRCDGVEAAARVIARLLPPSKREAPAASPLTPVRLPALS